MFDAFTDWVEAVAGPSYRYSRGMWVDSPAANEIFIASIHRLGGPGPDVDDRRQRYRVILLGPRNGRQHVEAVQQAIDSLAEAALGDTSPCGAASVRAIGEPVGPGYTTENRAWYSLDFEVLF